MNNTIVILYVLVVHTVVLLVVVVEREHQVIMVPGKSSQGVVLSLSRLVSWWERRLDRRNSVASPLDEVYKSAILGVLPTGEEDVSAFLLPVQL